MPERKKREITPGDIYSGISFTPLEFEGTAEKKLVKREVPVFVRYCKRLHKIAPTLGKNATFKPEYQGAIDFLGWELSAEEFSAAINLSFIFSMLVLIAVAFIIDLVLGGIIRGFLGNEMLAMAYMYLPFLAASIAFTNWIQKYPLSAAKVEQTRALTYVPEIMGYMIMSMKLFQTWRRL